jgi:hypothetical protein
MKKKLSEIFDEARPHELDQFSDEIHAPELPDEVLASVKGKVYAKTKLKKEKKNTKGVWLRFGSLAACLVLIVSAVIVVPMMREDIEPYIPTEDGWSPIIGANVRDVVLSADEVGKVFDMETDGNGTNQYTKIYASSPEYLGLDPLPNAEYLPLYSTNHFTLSKSEFQNFIDEYWDSATAFFAIDTKNYEIEKGETWAGAIYYAAKVSENEKYLRFTAVGNKFCFRYYDFCEDRLKINDSMVSILESDTDEQIKEKLQETIATVCASFGKQYTNIKICRQYSYQQLDGITVYLYSDEETIFPSNFSESPMTSDYMTLTFHTDWGSGTRYDWGGSKDEAYLIEVSLNEIARPWNEYYTVDAKATMLTLEEAEQLLEKGYVFGGHSCPLCMAEQAYVDFSDYTYVDIEYVSDEKGEICIPFYAFYKYLGETQYGVRMYAKTYVPAVVVSGYDEYFESQKDSHRSNGSNGDYEVW